MGCKQAEMEEVEHSYDAAVRRPIDIPLCPHPRLQLNPTGKNNIATLKADHG